MPHIPVDMAIKSMKAAVVPSAGGDGVAVSSLTGSSVTLAWAHTVASITTVDHQRGTGLHLGTGHVEDPSPALCTLVWTSASLVQLLWCLLLMWAWGWV